MDENKWKKQMFSFMEGKPNDGPEISVSHSKEWMDDCFGLTGKLPLSFCPREVMARQSKQT